MDNLALTYSNLGRYTEAEKLQIQVLDARSRILGKEHPHTIMSMGNLALTYNNLGRRTEAEKLQVQVLDATSRILGEEHPHTIKSMGNLALTYSNLGKYTEAEKLQVQVLDARCRVLGEGHPDTVMSKGDLAVTYSKLGKYTEVEKLRVQELYGQNLKGQILDSRVKFLAPEHPDAMAKDIMRKLLQDTVADKLQVQVLDAGKEVVETEHPLITGAMTHLAPNCKQLVLGAKVALQHLQQFEAEIKAALSLSGISEVDYMLLAGFNESVIHSGIGYLEEIHVILKSEFPSDSDLLSSLGRIFSPFPGTIFTTCPPYCFKTPVFNSEGKAQEWDEVVFMQAHTYTTLRMGHTMKEMELMSASICLNEYKILSASRSGGSGYGNEKKQDTPQGRRRIGGNPKKGSEKDSKEGDNNSEGDDDDSEGGNDDSEGDDDGSKGSDEGSKGSDDDSEGDDDDSKGGDPDDPDSRDNSDTHLPQISFNIQTEIYPNTPPVLASEPSSSKHSKYFQLLQLEGSIAVQVGFSSRLIHKKQLILFQTKPPLLKPRQLASSYIEFKELNLQSIPDVDSAYYHLAHFRAEINTREELTKFKNIKPASTRAVDSETRVIEENKQTLAATLGSTFGISGLKPTGLFSISGTKTKESSSTKELKVFNSRIIQKNHDGAVWWEFIVDDPYQQQQGLNMQGLGTLPCVSCTFVESSDDAPPPPAPDLFGVEVMSCWSLIPSKSNPLSLLASWLALGSSEVKPPTPYSNLCQIMLLDLPSQLSTNSYYKAVAKATPSSWMAFDVKRPSPHKFTSYINFSSSEGGAK
jgi:tetratricopeptide (TPR) repeat protein